MVFDQIPPTRVDCNDLPADSPWRRPGQICGGDAPAGGGPLEFINDLIQGALHPGATSPAQTASTETGIGKYLLLGGAALGAYWAMKKWKR